jgi:hypothetical protein
VNDLVRLSNSLSGLIVFTDDEMELLIVANDYYAENRYPGLHTNFHQQKKLP